MALLLPFGNLWVVSGAHAQSCAQEDFHILDFWVGEWEVFSGQQQVGTNRIERVLDGCAVLEHWTAADGGEGKSLFYHIPATREWKQVWVTEDALRPGGVKEKMLVERLRDGSIRFQGEIPLPGGAGYLDRTTLTPLPEGAVRQVIERSIDGGATWEAGFDAVYRRRGRAAALDGYPGRVRADAENRISLVTRVTNAYPSFSPDGSKIAYTSNADGDFDIHVVDLEEGLRLPLTDAPDRDGTPVWSPDGLRIAFQSFRDGRSQIYVMDADGGNQRNVSRSLSNDEHPAWSVDGERILFSSDRPGSGNIDIYEMRADGGGVRRITETPEVETYASWSPDGTRIVCRKILADGNWEVVVMDGDGRNPRVLSPHPAEDGWPVWSPDGARIAFASLRAGTSDIYVMDADGSELTRITNDGSDDRQPAWSQDGTQIAFARYYWFPGEPFDEASEIHLLELEARSP